MVEVEVLPGAGRLEVYSTHLIYGTGLVGGRATHDPVRRHRLRMAQVDELVAFVQRVHDPANVVAIVGDCNVPALAPTFPTGPRPSTTTCWSAWRRSACATSGPSLASARAELGSAVDPFADQIDLAGPTRWSTAPTRRRRPPSPPPARLLSW